MKKVLISVPVGGFQPEQIAEVDDATAADWVAHGLAQYVVEEEKHANVKRESVKQYVKQKEA
jgi:predicted site-specific integrase-resolvase